MTQSKRPKKQPKGDYAVGYCRPPERSRIPPGKVLNPHGRNGKKVDEPDAFERTRRRLSRVTIEGETQMLPSDEAYWLRTMAAAMAGDKTAARIIAQELRARTRTSPVELAPTSEETAQHEAEQARREELSKTIIGALDTLAAIKGGLK